MFRIRVTAIFGKQRTIPAFVVDYNKSWDGSWYSRNEKNAKLFKLKRNAEKWLKERSDVTGVVEEVPDFRTQQIKLLTAK